MLRGASFVSHLSVLVTSRLLLVLMIIGAPAYAAAATLQEISYSALPGGSVRITMTADQPLDAPRTFTTDNPARIAWIFLALPTAWPAKASL